MKTRKFIFPVLAAMIAVGAAFATSQKAAGKSKPVLATFNVDSEDATSYHVTSVQDPDCGNGNDVTCKISSTATPDANNRILKTQATATDWRSAD